MVGDDVGAGDRHQVHTRHDPGVDIGESKDLGAVVIIAAATLVFIAGVGSCGDKPVRSAARSAEEPAPTAGFDGGVDVGDEVGIGFVACFVDDGLGVVADE